MPTARPGKAGAEVITDFCAQPPADVVLLVTGGEWSKKHGGKWSEAIARTGCLVVARQVRPDQMTGWVEARLRKRGVKADRGAVQRLVERVEGNLLAAAQERSEEHTSELQSLMRISYAVFCLNKKKTTERQTQSHT